MMMKQILDRLFPRVQRILAPIGMPLSGLGFDPWILNAASDTPVRMLGPDIWRIIRNRRARMRYDDAVRFDPSLCNVSREARIKNDGARRNILCKVLNLLLSGIVDFHHDMGMIHRHTKLSPALLDLAHDIFNAVRMLGPHIDMVFKTGEKAMAFRKIDEPDKCVGNVVV